MKNILLKQAEDWVIFAEQLANDAVGFSLRQDETNALSLAGQASRAAEMVVARVATLGQMTMSAAGETAEVYAGIVRAEQDAMGSAQLAHNAAASAWATAKRLETERVQR